MSVLAEFKDGILNGERRWLMWCDASTVRTDAPELGAFRHVQVAEQFRIVTHICPPGIEEGWPDATRYRLVEVLESDGIAVYEVLTTPA